MFRSLGALVGDLLVVILFVAAGFLQHGTPLTSENIFLVGWPFAAGLLLGHLVIRSWRAPFRLLPHGVLIWAIMIATGMAVRTLFGAGTETSFVLVTAGVTGVLMLGWRALALFLTRHERLEVIDATADADGGPSTETPAADATSPASPAADTTSPDSPAADATSRQP
ncbi:MAG TPA: DUF3054 domain-containing protein [Candidatus Brachybacterium merdigallinarum]|nr:DUF3054 domain-containing protein [Candidatus Brachybacterium merdigallinarum]